MKNNFYWTLFLISFIYCFVVLLLNLLHLGDENTMLALMAVPVILLVFVFTVPIRTRATQIWKWTIIVIDALMLGPFAFFNVAGCILFVPGVYCEDILYRNIPFLGGEPLVFAAMIGLLISALVAIRKKPASASVDVASAMMPESGESLQTAQTIPQKDITRLIAKTLLYIVGTLAVFVYFWFPSLLASGTLSVHDNINTALSPFIPYNHAILIILLVVLVIDIWLFRISNKIVPIILSVLIILVLVGIPTYNVINTMSYRAHITYLCTNGRMIVLNSDNSVEEQILSSRGGMYVTALGAADVQSKTFNWSNTIQSTNVGIYQNELKTCTNGYGKTVFDQYAEVTPPASQSAVESSGTTSQKVKPATSEQTPHVNFATSPAISSVPLSSVPGSQVTVSGKNFLSTGNVVYLDNTEIGSFPSDKTGSKIIFTLPSTTSLGDHTLTIKWPSLSGWTSVASITVLPN